MKVAGYLSKEGRDVIGIVKEYQKEPLSNEGLNIEGVRGSHNIKLKVDTQLKEEVDLAIVTTKTNNVEEIIKENSKFLRKATIVSTQNGVQADWVLNTFFPEENLISGIVMFGATFYPPNKVVHNFEGDLILGNIWDEKVFNLDKVKEFFNPTFNTVILENIKGAKYLKLFINLNNCIPAILGKSMQEVFADLDLAKLAIRLNKEAFDVISNYGIALQSLPTYPKERIQGLVSMPLDEAAGLFSKIMTNLSKEPLYGSILQSIKRGKKSEIDYINGEVFHLAIANKSKAPLNEKIVALVHEVEETSKFFSKEELLSQMRNIS